MKLYSKAIRYFLMAKRLNNNYIVNNKLLHDMYSCFAQSGFKNDAVSILEELLSQENDSLKFLQRLSNLEYVMGNTELALHYQLMAYSHDSLNQMRTLKLCKLYALMNNKDKMLDYFNRYLLLIHEKNQKEFPDKYIGYAYLVLGHKEESDYHFNKVLERNIRIIEIGAANESNYAPEYEIACIYSAKGEINKALEYLMHYKKKKSCPAWLISSLKQNPMLNQVRQNSEFEKILEHLEFNFNKERNKIENVLLNEGIFQL